MEFLAKTTFTFSNVNQVPWIKRMYLLLFRFRSFTKFYKYGKML